MPTSTIIGSLDTIAQNVKELGVVNVYWWNTQWFSALVGAVSGLLFSAIYNNLERRQKELRDFYEWFLKHSFSMSPDALLSQGGRFLYGHTTTDGDGRQEITPDKPIGEKMVIELRKQSKYWYMPASSIRLRLKKYQNLIGKIPNDVKFNEIKNTKEYLIAVKFFQKIDHSVKRKMGENEWTI